MLRRNVLFFFITKMTCSVFTYFYSEEMDFFLLNYLAEELDADEEETIFIGLIDQIDLIKIDKKEGLVYVFVKKEYEKCMIWNDFYLSINNLLSC